MSPNRPRGLRVLAAFCFLLAPFWGAGTAAADGHLPGEEKAAEAPAAGADPHANLTGREIYDRQLENRFDLYEEDLQMQSGDRGGNTQLTEMQVRYMNFREESKRILSKSIMKYQAPQDVRHLGYLVINKADGSEDQFIYRPSSRRVQRVNLRGEAVFGTDFAFEDIIPQELENATYDRKPDSDVDGVPVFVVEVTPVKEQDSEYSKFLVYITKDHFVALRVVYWDRDDLKVKELNSEYDSITKFEAEQKDGMKTIYIAMRQKIVHLRLDSWTDLTVVKMNPDVKLKSRHFSERELTKGR